MAQENAKEPTLVGMAKAAEHALGRFRRHLRSARPGVDQLIALANQFDEALQGVDEAGSRLKEAMAQAIDRLLELEETRKKIDLGDALG